MFEKNHEAAFDLAQSDKEIGSEKCEAGEKMLARHKAVGEGNRSKWNTSFCNGYRR